MAQSIQRCVEQKTNESHRSESLIDRFPAEVSPLDIAVPSDIAVPNFATQKSQKGDGHVIERKARHQTNSGACRINFQRHGTNCAWRVFVAHILYPIVVRRAYGVSGHVVWDLLCSNPMFRDCDCVR